MNRQQSRGAGAVRALVTASAIMFATTAAGAAVMVRTAVRFRPVARAAAVVGTAAVTAAVVGSVVRSLPPQCGQVVIGHVAYHQCGGTWYQPQYVGSSVTYVVVNPPR